MITSRQCRMARAALGWSTKDLAREAKVGEMTVTRFENERAKPIPATLRSITQAFEAAGVRFTERGVEMAEPAAA